MRVVDSGWLFVLVMTINAALYEDVTLFRIPVDD
jgi:hypothetical protein